MCVKWNLHTQGLLGKGQVSLLKLALSQMMMTCSQQKSKALSVTASPENLVLIVRGTVIDNSAFQSLGAFLDVLSAQQRSHLVLGLGVKVHSIGCMVW